MPQYELPADLRLEEAKNTQLSIWWPAPIQQRFQALLARANAAGAKTTQKELLAALILSVQASGDELEGHVRHFRRAVVRDAILDGQRQLQGEVRLLEFRTGHRNRTARDSNGES